jgi:phosphopantothenoylcysteine decarboxylase/phosphopantothenate--cysteine ligase
MGGDRNRITLVSKGVAERWPEMDKTEVAARIAALVAERLETVTV